MPLISAKQLKTRISNEFKNQICWKTSNRLSEYKLQFDHDFAWEETKILNEIPYIEKRLISEMLHIKRQKNDLNS